MINKKFILEHMDRVNFTDETVRSKGDSRFGDNAGHQRTYSAQNRLSSPQQRLLLGSNYKPRSLGYSRGGRGGRGTPSRIMKPTRVARDVRKKFR